MPSSITTLETGFPTFTGEETPQQQIYALHSYLFQLREGLVYSLRNLSAENFNTTALQSMTEAQKNEIAPMLTQVKNLASELSTKMDTISGRLTGAESEIARVGKKADANENAIKSLQTTVSEIEMDLEELGDRVQAMEDELPLLEETAADLAELENQVAGQEQSIGKLTDAVRVAEDGSVTIGAPGQVLRLVGTVYINGVLYEQGGTT